MPVLALRHKIVRLISILAILLTFGLIGLNVYAAPFAPGASLMPSCTPGSVDCTVQILPDQTGNAGKFLQTNGSGVLSWVDGTSPNIANSDLALSNNRILSLSGHSLTLDGASDFVFDNSGGLSLNTLDATGTVTANAYNGSGANLTLSRIGSSTFSTVQDLQNVFHSAGWTSGGAITDAGGETIHVTAGTGLMRTSNSAISTVSYMDYPATDIAIPTNSVRYIGVEYNSGSPQVVARTSSNWNLKTDWSLGVIVNEGGSLTIYTDRQAVGDHAANMVQREYESMPIEPDVRNGGLMFDETGTRNITLTAGAVWDRLNRYVVPALNTSLAGSFDAYYRTGVATFHKDSGLTAWPNTLYDNGSSLSTMTNGYYSVLWFYLDTNAMVSMVYGRGEYSTSGLAEAESAPMIDTLPDRVKVFSRLLGKIVFQKGASSAERVVSLLDMGPSSVTGVTSHSDLTGLDYVSSGHTGFANAVSGVNDNITSMTAISSLAPTGALNITGAGASVWSTSLGALTVDSSAALNLGTTNATSLNLGRTSVLTTNSGNFNLLGSFITTKGSDYTTTGTQNNVNIGQYYVVDYVGVSAATFTGITGGVDGRQIRISNHSSSNLMFTNQDTNSTDINRIITTSGGTLTVPANSSIELQYDGGVNRWQVTGITANAATIGAYAYIQGGNAFGAGATLGTTDANSLTLITSGANRFTLATGAATLTGSGATSLVGGSTLSLSSAAGSALNIVSGTTGVLTLDSGSTGAVNLGNGTNAKTVTIGNIIGATAVNINTGSGGSTITTTNGNFTLTTGTGSIALGTDTVAKSITVGNATGATSVGITAGSGGISAVSSSGITLNPYGVGVGNTSELRFAELAAGGSNYVGFKAADALGGNIIWTLPTSDGTTGQILTTNGTGTLSWSDAGACPTCVTNTSKFNVDVGTGNITKINNVVTSFPSSQGGAGDVLTNDGAGNLTWSPVGSGSTALSSISAATGNATIANGNSNINWNWTLTGASTGFSISETAAGSGSGYLARIGTIAASTEKPFSIAARGTTIFDTSATGGLTLGDSTTLNTPITLQSGTGTISMGADSVAHTVVLGNSTGATAVNINSGSGGINFGGSTVIAGSNTFATGTGTTTINSTAINLAANSAIIDLTGSGTLGLNTTTNRAITTGTGLFTIGGGVTVSGNTTLAGAFITPKGADYSTTGSQNDVNFGAGYLFRYTGAFGATFTGIAGGSDGKQIRIMNASSSDVILSNDDAASSVGNRILTSTGANITIAPGVSIGLQYDSTAGYWRVVVLPAISTTISGFAFIQGGNAFGATASLGTTDANTLNLITGGANRFSISASAATITGNGATAIASSAGGALAVDSAAALNLGTATATSLSVGRTGVTTTNNGALISTQTLTASSGFTLTTGALNLTTTSGTIAGLGNVTITGATPLVFDGASPDANKTTFAITDPTGARTITFPNSTITVNAAADISGTTLASNVVTTSITAVGALSTGSIASGFGSISTTNNITTSGSISTTGSGTIIAAGALTASNGFTMTTGVLSLTATSGSFALSGLGASSISTGASALTITASNFNTTATGINSTNIGATTPGSGKFTTLISTGATDLANAGASNVTIATTGTGTVTIGNATGTFALTSSGGLNVSTGGALTGVASVDTIAHSATAITFAGAGTVASGAASALTITGNAASTWSTSSGNLTLQAGSGTVSLGTSTTLAFIGTTPAISIGNTGTLAVTDGTNTLFSVVDQGAFGTLRLTDKGSTGDPATCTAGDIYFNATDRVFKGCTAANTWTSLSQNDNVKITSETASDALAAANTSLGINVTITPKSTTSEILLNGYVQYNGAGTANVNATIQVRRGTLVTDTLVATTSCGTTDAHNSLCAWTAVDSPATTSATTYSVWAQGSSASGTMTNKSNLAMEVNLGADAAELYGTNDESLVMGDVVSLDEDLNAGVRKSASAYDRNALGVISTQPGLLMGAGERAGAKSVPVALTGRVPVKVSGENGPIAIGDYLTTSSKPGVAMRAAHGGTMIGQAMSAYDDHGTGAAGVVIIFLKNTYLPDESFSQFVLAEGVTPFTLDIQNEAPHDSLSVIADKIANGFKLVTDFVAARVTAIRGYFDETHQRKLCIGDAKTGNETCVTKEQLDRLLSNQNSADQQNVNAPSAPPAYVPPPTTPDTNTNGPVTSAPAPEPTIATENLPAPETTEPPTPPAPPAPETPPAETVTPPASVTNDQPPAEAPAPAVDTPPAPPAPEAPPTAETVTP